MAVSRSKNVVLISLLVVLGAALWWIMWGPDIGEDEPVRFHLRQTIVAHEPFSWQLKSIDGDVAWDGAVSLHPGMTWDADSATLSWQDPTAAAEPRHASISGHVKGRVQIYEIELIVAAGNHPPAWTAKTLPDAVEDTPYRTLVPVVDPDGDPLTGRLLAAPKGVELVQEGATVVLAWENPQPAATADHELRLEIRDQQHFIQHAFRLRVQAVNDPPRIRSTPPLAVVPGRAYTYQVSAVDEEGEDLTYTLLKGPPGMRMGARSGLLQWTPESDALPVTEVIIQVADPLGASARQRFELEFTGLIKVGVIGDLFLSTAELDDEFMVGISSSRLVVFRKSSIDDIVAQHWTHMRGVRYLAAYRGHVYVVDRKDGIVIYDLSDPTKIVPAGTFTCRPAHEAEPIIRGDRLYLSCQEPAGIRVFSLSDPAAPQALTPVTIQPVAQMTIAGDRLYACDRNTIYAFDLSTQDEPRELGRYSPEGMNGGGAIFVRPPYLYHFRMHKLYTVAISDLDNMQDVGEPVATAYCNHVVEHGGKFWAWGQNGFYIWDVSNPQEPQVVLSYRNHVPEWIMFSGDAAYLREADGRVVLAKDAHRPLTNQTPPYVAPSHLAVARGHLFAIADGLQVYDLADPLQPRKVGQLAGIGSVMRVGMQVSDDLLMIQGSIVDIADPARPRLLHKGRSFSDVGVVGDRAFLIDEKGLSIVDLTDPSNPRVLARHEQERNDPCLAIADNGLIFIADWSGSVASYSIDGEHRVAPLGEINVKASRDGLPLGMQLVGDQLYVALNGEGVVRLDVSDPANLRKAAWYDTSQFTEQVVPVDGIAVVADGSGGVLTVDLREAGIGRVLGSMGTTDWTRGVAVHGDYIYSADGEGGIGIFRSNLSALVR